MRRLSCRKAWSRRDSGTTLVEMVVSVLLLSILMAMVAGIVFPAFQVFMRIQRAQFAQMIADTTLKEIKGQLREAAGYIKVYKAEDTDGNGIFDDATDITAATEVPWNTGGTGQILEYTTVDHAVILLSAEGCAETRITRGSSTEGTIEMPAGRLILRYYAPDIKKKEDNTIKRYSYKYKNTAAASTEAYEAWAVVTPFAEKYYKGLYLDLEFTLGTLPGGNADNYKYHAQHAKNTQVVNAGAILVLECLAPDEHDTYEEKFISVTAKVYDKPGGQLLAQGTEAMDFRFVVKRYNPFAEGSDPAVDPADPADRKTAK